MAPMWNARLVLGLCLSDEVGWLCAGTRSRSCTTDRRPCNRPVRSTELGKIAELLSDMESQMPDQIDHNVLLHLACACLCAEAHRGRQEARVIYRWTELMSNEAEAIRARATKTWPDPPEPSSPSRIGEGAVDSDEDVGLAGCTTWSPRPKRATKRKRPTVLADLDLANADGRLHINLARTPTAMSFVRQPSGVIEEESEPRDDENKWETETVIRSSPPVSPSRQPQVKRLSAAELAPPLIIVPPGSLKPPSAHTFPPSPPDSATLASYTQEQHHLVPLNPSALTPGHITTHLPLPATPNSASTSSSFSALSPSVPMGLRHLPYNPLQDIPISPSYYQPSHHQHQQQQLEQHLALLQKTHVQQARLLAQTAELRLDMEKLRKELVDWKERADGQRQGRGRVGEVRMAAMVFLVSIWGLFLSFPALFTGFWAVDKCEEQDERKDGREGDLIGHDADAATKGNVPPHDARALDSPLDGSALGLTASGAQNLCRRRGSVA